MCTAINFRQTKHYFGRNLDLECSFNEKVVITPRNYNFLLRNGENYQNQYAMIGMATVVQDYPLYAEAANEKGLAIAGLNFPNNAYYPEFAEDKNNITPFELIPYILGQCSNLEDVKAILKDLNLVNINFAPSMPLAPLHYIISDKYSSIVMEPMYDGIKIYDNPYEVLTNNPPFAYHNWNIQQYLNLSPKNGENKFSSKFELNNYAQGMGAFGLPGDASSSSRFIRACFNLTNSVCHDDEISNVTQFMHILDSVAMVQGATITPENQNDITTYSCCINVDDGIYYYKTYNNNQISAISMQNVDLESSRLFVYELNREQNIQFDN